MIVWPVQLLPTGFTSKSFAKQVEWVASQL